MKQGDTTIQGQADTLPKAFCGQFIRDNTLADGTQAITGLGFKPSAVLFLLANVTGNSDEFSIGFQSDNIDFVAFDNNVAGIDKWSMSGTWAMYFHTSGSAANGGRITAYDTDGFTITWSKSGTPLNSSEVKFMAFK